MAVRPLVATGAMLASAGLIVTAAPTIAPSLTARDVQVVADTDAALAVNGFEITPNLDSLATGLELAAAVADVDPVQLLQDDPTFLEILINAFFSGFPDTNGQRGIVGVAAALTANSDLAQAFFVGFPDGDNRGIVGVAAFLTDGIPIVNSFVVDGIVGVADELTEGNELANAFVNDGIVGVADVLTEGVPIVNSFVNGGIVGVADELTEGVPIVNAFVNGGIVGVAQELSPENSLASAFFTGFPPASDGGTPDDDSDDTPAGPAGIVGATNFILIQIVGGPSTAAPDTADPDTVDPDTADPDTAAPDTADNVNVLAAAAPVTPSQETGEDGPGGNVLATGGATAQTGAPGSVSERNLVPGFTPNAAATPNGGTLAARGGGAPVAPNTGGSAARGTGAPGTQGTTGDDEDQGLVRNSPVFRPAPIWELGNRSDAVRDPFQGWKDLGERLGLGGGRSTGGAAEGPSGTEGGGAGEGGSGAE